jgi:hypothetical protein
MLLRKPYQLLLYLAIILLLVSFVAGKEPIDIHLHDTYIIIGIQHVYIVLALFSFLFWGLYILLHPLLPLKILTWIDVTGTVLAIIYLLVSLSNKIGFETTELPSLQELIMTSAIPHY